MLIEEWLAYEARQGRSKLAALQSLDYHTGTPVEHGRLSRMRRGLRPIPDAMQDFMLRRGDGDFLRELLEQHGIPVSVTTADALARRLSPLP